MSFVVPSIHVHFGTQKSIMVVQIPDEPTPADMDAIVLWVDATGVGTARYTGDGSDSLTVDQDYGPKTAYPGEYVAWDGDDALFVLTEDELNSDYAW